MRLKRTCFGFAFGLMVLLIACGTSSANGLITLEFDFDMTNQWSVDVNQNKTIDPTKIAGFCMQGDLIYEGIQFFYLKAADFPQYHTKSEDRPQKES